jgi:hypothetical protein
MPPVKKKSDNGSETLSETASETASDRYLRKIYYDTRESSVAFTGIGALWRFIKNDNNRPPGTDFKKVTQWLTTQNAHNVFKNPKKGFATEKIIVEYPDQMWDCDIMVMENAQANRGVRYVFCCIDIFSRYLWIKLMKTKTAAESGRALQAIISEHDRTCEVLRTDNGKEFTGAAFQDVLKQNAITHQIAYGAHKANYVERVQRTIQTRLYKYLYEKNTPVFTDVIDDIVKAYNSTPHSATGFAPAAVDQSNYKKIYENVYIPLLNKRATLTTAYTLDTGDLVRISLTREPFTRGYKQKFTEELFRVKNKIPSDPPRYRLEDLMGEDIKGSFYAEDLQKFHLKDTSEISFKIEKILGERTVGRRKYKLVKWRGYSKKFNSLVPNSTLK